MEVYHDAEHAAALKAHHDVVQKLYFTYDWSVVLQYDINQRLAWENNPSIDISTLDQDAFNMLVTIQICKGSRVDSRSLEGDETPQKYRRVYTSRRS